ncbi:phosphotransferase family protein [Aspergillus affinis]|uniref:phosphotransferase family protein n=1 Tax=Aspergillus affinis TaxID=1070780 RepID=UPI0022FE94F2|nr:kinase-like domain-containing protein [Aspergillus affinis]KAI9036879.1 kinase-like domain-containing protein [Aspergillus affinis]
MGSKPSAITRSPVGGSAAGTGSKAPESAKWPDPYRYTSGRWLNRDELERNSRYIRFDFSALCERAISLCPGATKIIECEKKEGGFNRVFIFRMDTGIRIVARLPTPIAGPPGLVTNSEVATMTYLRSKLNLAIPNVLEWNDSSSNPVGNEYIVQEHVAGEQLHQRWATMNSEQHMLCTKALSLAIRKMAALDFPAYGSLYFSDAPLPSEKKVPFEEGYCVGPHCGPVYWNCNPGELELYGGSSPNCGPYTGRARIPREKSVNEGVLSYQGQVHEHQQLLQTSNDVLERLLDDKRIQDAASPTLLHPDFHKRNIYVSADDPTVITGLIDWQTASIEPAFIYENETPDFAAPPNSEDEDTLEDEKSEAQRAKERKDASICHQTYDVCMKGLVPKLRPARLQDPTLFRLFHYAHTSWRDSAAAVRQELIELSGQWQELGLQGSCPYVPTEEELARHSRDYEDFETVQRLKVWLMKSLDTNSDGWVPNEAWEAAREAHRAAYEQWMETAREAEERGDENITVEKADKLWPWDAR